MLNKDEVLALVVSYEGGEELVATVLALRPQVGHVLIVDNGSGPNTRVVLDKLAAQREISVKLLNTNRGIGAALNVGIAFAKAAGFNWVLTMDQDSTASKCFMTAFSAALDSLGNKVVLTPAIVNHGVALRREESVESVSYAITSGNLLPLLLFDEVGLYDEGMFVDCIDFDFSLRLRRGGYRIYRVPTAVLNHRLGEAAEVPRWARRFYSRHSPTRRYYMYRNYCYLAERYLLSFPGFIVKLGIAQVLLTALIGLFDPKPRASYRAATSGCQRLFATSRRSNAANLSSVAREKRIPRGRSRMPTFTFFSKPERGKRRGDCESMLANDPAYKCRRRRN